MRIIEADFKKGHVKVRINNPDDLWHLSQILHKGDVVKGRSYRKIKLGGDEEKSSAVRKPVVVKIKVEKVEFDKYKQSLRVNGVVAEGPEDVSHGSYHTLNVEVDMVIEIEKESFLDFQIRHMQEASKERHSKILLCTLEREEAYFALLKKYGCEFLGELKGEVEKKYNKEKVRKDFYQEVIKILEGYIEGMGIEKIIVGSPAFWKDELYKRLPAGMRGKVVLATCNATGQNGINEMLKREEVKKALQDERVSKEMDLVERLLVKIAKNEPCCYGFYEVEEAANAGAVQILLVTDAFIRRRMHEESYELLNNVMKKVEGSRGEVHIISSDHNAGEKLDGLGGIAALLRWKVKEV